MHALSSVSSSLDIEESAVEARDASLFVRRVGGGAGRNALVTVHGGPGISHEVMELLEPLARADRAVITFDQRGVGRSTGRVDEANVFTQAVADLHAVVCAAEAGPVHLLGHSWGGLVAVLYAAAHPEMLSSLVLVDSIPPTSELLTSAWGRWRDRVRDFQERGLVPAELPGWDHDGTDHLLALLPIYFVDPRHPAARTLGGSRFSRMVSRACAPALADYDMRHEVARVRVPTLHVIAPVPFGVEMGAALADVMTAAPARRAVLSDAGHLPWLERPEPFLTLLESYLTEIEQTRTKGDRP